MGIEREPTMKELRLRLDKLKEIYENENLLEKEEVKMIFRVLEYLLRKVTIDDNGFTKI